MIKRTPIKRKTCKGENCLRYPTIGFSGWCWSCAPDEVKGKVKSKREQQQKVSNTRKVASNKLRLDDYKENVGLDLFFGNAAIELSKHPYCENCGEFIDERFYKAATAHVLPKRKVFGFPSVACNPLNKLFLGSGCGCHHEYDTSWDDASKMQIWSKVVLIFIELYPFIEEKEKKNIPEILRLHIPEKISQ